MKKARPWGNPSYKTPGFTVVELIVVLCMVVIFTLVAIGVYKEYKKGTSKQQVEQVITPKQETATVADSALDKKADWLDKDL